MSRWLAIVEQAEETLKPPPANRPEPAERGAETCGDDPIQPQEGFLPVSTGLPVKEFKQPLNLEDSAHGKSIGGRPITSSGKVVNLSEWRELTDWQRHGPAGKQFNGATMKWEDEK